MKKEKLILAAVSLFLVIISLVGMSAAIGAVQNETSVEKTEKESIREKRDVITKKTFQVFISGLDTYGEKGRSYRSDLNLLVTVNPSEKKLLITGIPRDLYVSLPATSSNEEKQKTKFSYLSLYGGAKSLIQGAEELLDTKIDYYIQLDMSGFQKLIDAIGGVDVIADRSFKTDWKTSFQKGINHVNGKEALTFVRERHHHLRGTEQRNKNHQQMLKAILKKVMKIEKPAKIVYTGGACRVSSQCTIKFDASEEGGDLGTIHYSITITEYKKTAVRKLKVKKKKKGKGNGKKAKVKKTSNRTSTKSKTGKYKVKKGDCLWNIARKFYGKGAKYTVIYNANKKVIGSNPNLIYPGQILTIPEE